MADKKQIVPNPEFEDQAPKYKLWEDLVEGGERIEKNDTYLPKHAYESDPQYKIRKGLATYKNHAAPIVTVFTSSVWRKPPDRGLPPELEKFVPNVDTLTNTANAFFQDADSKAAGTGIRFIVVDQTKVDEGAENATLADSQKLGIRPYFISVAAEKVPAWGYDDAGLAYVVVDETETKKDDPFEKPKTTKKYRIWYRKKWVIWEENEKSELVLGPEKAHPCGEVPVEPIYFSKKQEMVGESCIKDVASLLKRAYMLENALDKSLFDTAFPQQYFYGFSPEDITGYIKASSNGLVNSDSEAKSGFIEPSGNSFAALDGKVRRDEVSIREIALRMVRPESKVGESAEAKKIDNQQLHSQLSTASQNWEDAETRCWALAAKWLGKPELVDKITIEYNNDFDVEKVSAELLKAFSEMYRNKLFSRETIWEAMEKSEFDFPEDFDPIDEAAKIEKESMAGGAFGTAASNLLGGTGA